MTEAFRGVVSEVEELPDEEQDRIACVLQAELDRRWDELLESPESVRVLDGMAEKALSEIRNGRAKELEL